MKIKLSPWSKQVKKAMIDADMDTADLAKKLHCTRQYVSSVVNGRIYYGEAVEHISNYFGIEVPTDDKATLAKKNDEN